jgi:hypothetical protein
MALQTSGLIKLSDVNLELTHTSNTLISIAGTEGRLLGAKPTGSVNMSDFYGKSYVFYGTISTSQKELNLATWASANGWPGTFPAVITINSGVYIWSDNTAVAALTTGVFPRGLTIINNGYIMGKGGDGGLGNSGPPSAGFDGGNAISLGCNATINMAGTTSYIGGGGGGGSGGNGWGGGGGGAGGGKGGDTYYSSHKLGGAGGAIGQSGADGEQVFGNSGSGGSCGGGGGSGTSKKATDYCGAGGGGGRVFPGTSQPSDGGDGGGPGQAGTAGSGRGGGGGGGWGAAGGAAGSLSGGAAGNAIALNAHTATLTGTTSRIYGAVS